MYIIIWNARGRPTNRPIDHPCRTVIIFLLSTTHDFNTAWHADLAHREEGGRIGDMEVDFLERAILR